MTTKEKLIRQSIATVEARLIEIDAVLNSTPLIGYGAKHFLR